MKNYINIIDPKKYVDFQIYKCVLPCSTENTKKRTKGNLHSKLTNIQTAMNSNLHVNLGNTIRGSSAYFEKTNTTV